MDFGITGPLYILLHWNSHYITCSCILTLFSCYWLLSYTIWAGWDTVVTLHSPTFTFLLQFWYYYTIVVDSFWLRLFFLRDILLHVITCSVVTVVIHRIRFCQFHSVVTHHLLHLPIDLFPHYTIWFCTYIPICYIWFGFTDSCCYDIATHGSLFTVLFIVPLRWLLPVVLYLMTFMGPFTFAPRYLYGGYRCCYLRHLLVHSHTRHSYLYILYSWDRPLPQYILPSYLLPTGLHTFPLHLFWWTFVVTQLPHYPLLSHYLPTLFPHYIPIPTRCCIYLLTLITFSWPLLYTFTHCCTCPSCWLLHSCCYYSRTMPVRGQWVTFVQDRDPIVVVTAYSPHYSHSLLHSVVFTPVVTLPDLPTLDLTTFSGLRTVTGYICGPDTDVRATTYITFTAMRTDAEDIYRYLDWHDVAIYCCLRYIAPHWQTWLHFTDWRLVTFTFTCHSHCWRTGPRATRTFVTLRFTHMLGPTYFVIYHTHIDTYIYFVLPSIVIYILHYSYIIVIVHYHLIYCYCYYGLLHSLPGLPCSDYFLDTLHSTFCITHFPTHICHTQASSTYIYLPYPTTHWFIRCWVTLLYCWLCHTHITFVTGLLHTIYYTTICCRTHWFTPFVTTHHLHLPTTHTFTFPFSCGLHTFICPAGYTHIILIYSIPQTFIVDYTFIWTLLRYICCYLFPHYTDPIFHCHYSSYYTPDCVGPTWLVPPQYAT